MALVEVRNLRKEFRMERKTLEVLRGVDLDLEQGDRVSIIGPSGSGKSTFLHLLGTLDKPSAGSVNIGGQDVFALGSGKLASFRNQTIGFVFQFHHLLPDFTALENVLMPTRIARMPVQDGKEKAEALLERVGLADRLQHRPGELSGGEQQRVAMARALVLSPKLLLADEPTGNLDESSAEEIHQLLDEMHAAHDLTLVLVTHSSRLAARMDRKLTMHQGELVS